MARAVILLDTHALLWWALDPDKLSARAVEECARMERDGGFASSVSIWELAVKLKNGKLDIGISLAEFVRRIELGGVVELLAVDTSTWLQTVSLEWDHRDPADRIIVATAIAKGVPVLTRDEAIHGFSRVQCVW